MESDDSDDGGDDDDGSTMVNPFHGRRGPGAAMGKGQKRERERETREMNLPGCVYL
jgi:hypothetical protein